MMESRLEHLVCLSPDDLRRRSGELAAAPWKLLAHGDSWFSFAAAAVDAHARLLDELMFSQPTVAVSCAGRHDRLRRIDEWQTDDVFTRLLRDGTPEGGAWNGIVLSAGGNDLVAAACVPAHTAEGAAVPTHLRLLRHQTEWGAPSAGVSRYFSDAGWQSFSTYLRANLQHLLAERDAGPSQGKPVFLHTYAVPLPRPAVDARLFSTFKAYAIPQADWATLSRLMVSRLATLLKACAEDRAAFPNLQVFDSTQVPIAPAAAGASGISGDWYNELQLNHSGCFKIARAWSTVLEAHLSGKALLPVPSAPTRGRRPKKPA